VVLAVVAGVDLAVLLGLAWVAPRRWWFLWGWTVLGLLAIVILMAYISLALWLPLTRIDRLV